MYHRSAPLSVATTAVFILLCGAGCNNDNPSADRREGVFYSQCLTMPESRPRMLDLLFVIDDSSAMAGFQGYLRANLPALMTRLRNLNGGPTDLHIGVVSSVLGTAPHAVPGCPALGHAGMMHRGACARPLGATYIKDVKPSGCVADLDVSSHCLMHTCVEDNCGHEPGTWLVIDESTGCPRCRNYEGSLEDAFTCIAEVGASECPFSQPLEAMKQALQNHVNLRFRREDALLGIIFITAQDDCSAADPRLFAPEDGDLGPLTPFRRLEHGVTCVPNGRDPGPRQHCHPRDEPDGLLVRPGAYIEYLQGIVEPQRLMVAAVMGPFDAHDTLTVQLDAQGRPRLAPSCTLDATVAVANPAVRLHSLLAAFNQEEDLAHWAQMSICSADYTPVLAGAGLAIAFHPPSGCFELPLRGCPDPGAAVGEPGDEQTCNDACLPNCVVTDVHSRETPEETQASLPYCLEVCEDGPCPGNTDPGLAYAGGRPADRDFRLPVPACWYVSAGPFCGRNGHIVVARQANAPPRSFVDICCELVPDVEESCDDGLDGDEDCLVDLEDPDCAPGQL